MTDCKGRELKPGDEVTMESKGRHYFGVVQELRPANPEGDFFEQRDMVKMEFTGSLVGFPWQFASSLEVHNSGT